MKRPSRVGSACAVLASAAALEAATGAEAVEEPKQYLVRAENPEPDRLPTLGVWTRGKEVLVSASFPELPGFVFDAWCYESDMEFIAAEAGPGGRIVLRHRLRGSAEVVLATTVTPEAGAVEFLARPEAIPSGWSDKSSPLPTPNLCWQLQRAVSFRSAPDPYPEFVKRCFIFTDRGMTFLHETLRRRIPCRAPEDPYNNPPWVQSYVGTWQDIPPVGPASWADYSLDRYTTTVIGVVSRDGRYLAALANDSATSMHQAWHDCLHNNAQWLPAEAPPERRSWRVKAYLMRNDARLLLDRVRRDFPGAVPRTTIHQTAGVKDNLPVFGMRCLERMRFPMSWLSGHYSEFDLWRSAGRAKVMECLLTAPPPAPFNPVALAEQDRGSYVARKVVFNLTADSRVLGLLLVPKGPGPFPGVLLLHDHGAKFDIGKEKVVRPWGDSPERSVSARRWAEACYGGRFLGDELARRGYVYLACDALNWSDRGGAGYEGQQALAANLLHMGMSLAGCIAHEDLRMAEFLAAQPEVDPKRIGAMGLSMGAFRTWQLAALSDRIAAGVAVCWMATVKGLMVPGNNQTRGQSAFTMTHPGLFNYLDYPDVASLACPKPMLFYNGRRDALFPVPAVEEAYSRLRRVWESQGAGQHLVTKLWDTGHVFDQAMQDEAFAWLDLYLRPGRSR